jgi:hypothetical protein
MRECDASQVPIRRPSWVNSYERQSVPGEFPGGPSDTYVLVDYPNHIARCVHDEFVSKNWHFYLNVA